MTSTDVIVNPTGGGDVVLPVNPFVSNRYHFGMLLGVADLETEQAYHRGKAWLHNAWLHGTGCVWGLEVEVRPELNEVAVKPGLAVDGHGRELFVGETMCVDLTRWYTERRPDSLPVTDEGEGVVSFVIHVELCHESCLDRPVPSIAEPCQGATQDTAYSRAVERGLPRLVAGPVGSPPPPLYPLVRQFLGQLPVDSDLVATALSAVAAADTADQAPLAVTWFRRLAAADSMRLAPEPGAPPWSPVAGDGCVPLAQLTVHLRQSEAGLRVVVDGDRATTVDNLIRPTLLRTGATQDFSSHLGHV